MVDLCPLVSDSSLRFNACQWLTARAGISAPEKQTAANIRVHYMDHPKTASARKALQSTHVGGGAQSIDRAVTVLLLVGRAGPLGARLVDLVSETLLSKPTVHRMLTALVRTGLVDQDATTRRYHLGPEVYVLGTLASSRFGLHTLAQSALARLANETGDTACLSVARDVYAICLHQEEGAYPIRTHALKAGDRHPLGVGANSLALLSALPDAQVEHAIAANAETLARNYPHYTASVLRTLVAQTRERGYALNPGMMLPGLWAMAVLVRDSVGAAIGAISLAAIESRFDAQRQRDLFVLLQREAAWIEQRFRQLGSKGPMLRRR